MEFIDLLVHSEINRYNQSYLIITRIVKYQSFVIRKYNKPIRSAISSFNKVVSDLDIETCTPDS